MADKSEDPVAFGTLAELGGMTVAELADQKTPEANAELAEIKSALACYGWPVAILQLAKDGGL